MAEDVNWKSKYQKSLNEVRRVQNNIKMEPIELGRFLSELQEAVNHLPDKDFKKIVKQEFGISPASAYRYINVWQDLKWNPELVKNLRWSIIVKIIESNLPDDWKKDLILNGKPNLKNADWDNLFKLWAEGKINRGDPEYDAMIEQHEKMLDYHKQRDIEQNRYVPYFDEISTFY
jgi:hypothetical protein